MSDMQGSYVQPAQPRQCSCASYVMALFSARCSGAISLRAYMLPGSGEDGAFAMASQIAVLLLIGLDRETWLSRARSWRGLFVLIASLILTACLPKEPAPDPNGTFGSSVTAMDHDPSDTFVPTVFVDGRWVGEASGGGGIVASGINLPRRWHPGLTAVVKWQRCVRLDPSHPISSDEACHWVEKVVPIHKYEEVGHTDVHILAGDQVLIIPTMLDPEHPDYPRPGYPTKDFFRNTGKKQAQ